MKFSLLLVHVGRICDNLVIILFRRRLLIQLLHKREVYVQLLRLLHLRSLTQLSERLPEFVFLTVSRLQATFLEKVITFRSTALFSSVAEELRICLVQDTTSSEVLLIQQA